LSREDRGVFRVQPPPGFSKFCEKGLDKWEKGIRLPQSIILNTPSTCKAEVK